MAAGSVSRELDALIAERLGLRVVYDPPGWSGPALMVGIEGCASYGFIKDYSTSIAAAMGEPLAEMRRRGWTVVICCGPSEEDDEVNVRKQEAGDWVVSLAPIPEALCLAFLKATEQALMEEVPK